ncbi:hypothetical protein H1R20_g5118, partial [Candolleomyces eurysporus]
MRAVLIKDGKGSAENLYIGEADKPSAGNGEVLVQIKAFGLNRMDISQREGKYPPPPGASQILGVEFSGIIVELGEGVSDWKTGDAVFGLVGGGCYAEYINVPQTHIMKKPEHLSNLISSVMWPPWGFIVTAFQALVLIGKIQNNDNVLVHAGASGVGLSAIQLARIYGAFNGDVVEKITGETGQGPIRIYIHKVWHVHPLHHVYPWTQIIEAHREMEDNKNSGKIVVEVN